jgi:hypothetical protein
MRIANLNLVANEGKASQALPRLRPGSGRESLNVYCRAYRQTVDSINHLMSPLNSLCFLLLLGLTGCSDPNPLPNIRVQRPDSISTHAPVYSVGSPTGPRTDVTNQDDIESVLSQLGGLKSGWHRHRGKVGEPDLVVEIERDQKNIARLFMYSDRVYVHMPDSDITTHWTSMTKQEHDGGLHALGLKSE